MLFHSEFKIIPRRQGESSRSVYENTVSMLTTPACAGQAPPIQGGLEYGMESANGRITRNLPNGTTSTYAYSN